jgi:hypothetical protein
MKVKRISKKMKTALIVLAKKSKNMNNRVNNEVAKNYMNMYIQANDDKMYSSI